MHWLNKKKKHFEKNEQDYLMELNFRNKLECMCLASLSSLV